MEKLNSFWQPAQNATPLPSDAKPADVAQKIESRSRILSQPKSQRGFFHFFLAGLVRHAQTGSFIPSQRHLIDVMIAPVTDSYAGTVIELGTGTAPLTVRLAVKCPKARVLSCEINPVLAQDARVNLERAGINGQVEVKTTSAEDFLVQLRERNGAPPGFIISGLPLGNLSRNAVRKLLQNSKDILAPNGMFVQAQHFLVDRKNVKAIFREVRTVPVLRNFPPVFVYYAKK
jgi:phospholipid N-methyltransferase